MSNDILNDWERFLTPSILRSNMLVASVYIAAFETLKSAIVDRIRDFYWMGWEEGKDFIDPSYKNEVLSLNRSLFFASFQWLKDHKAIDDADVASFEKAKKIRNQLAHEFPSLLAKGLPSELPERLSDIITLLDKIERWWIVFFEIPINPDLAEVEINENEIVPGSVINLKMMMDVALGTDEVAEAYIKEFWKQRGGEN